MIYRLRLNDLGAHRQNLIIVPLSEKGFAKGGTIGEVLSFDEKSGIVFCIKNDDTDYFYAMFCHCMLKKDYDKLPQNVLITLLPNALEIIKK